jgi:protein required for attachment to host cells
MPAAIVVVADRTRARFIETDLAQSEPRFEERDGLADDTARLQNHELVTDKAGRRTGMDGPGNRGTSDTGSADYHREAAENFAREIARRLEADANRNAFDQLVICAEPRFLGFLRGAMPKRLEGLVVGEVHKDLAQSRLEEIRTHVLAAIKPAGNA